MSYKVQLDIFEGPLDLLLHLVRENQVDIYDIPVARISDQYFQYLDLMKTLNIEVAGDYLVMAATLVHIKSRMLLPRLEESPGEEEDPRQELVDRLLEHQQYRAAAGALRDREAASGGIFPRGLAADSVIVPDGPLEEEDLLEEVSIFELVKAFESVLAKIGTSPGHRVEVDEMEMAERLSFVLERVRPEGIAFSALFEEMARRIEVVATFLAVLELLRQRLIRVRQAGARGTLYIYPPV